MKTIYFALVLMLASSLASAQVVIENPTVGVSVLTEIVKEVAGVEDSRSSTTTVQADTLGAGLFESTSAGTGSQTVYVNSKDLIGALEFSLENVEIPTSFTASNFTAKLVGLSGQATSASVSLSIDLFDMADSQEDNEIQDFDRDLAEDAVSIQGDPVVNGEFEDGIVDVTAQLRADLFGDSTEGVSTGFILQASGGTGLIEFPGIADAYIEMNLIGSDTDADTDSDTSVVIEDTSADTATVDTEDSESAVMDTATENPGTDSGETGDTATSTDDNGDSEYWDTVDEDSDDNHNSDGDGNVKCTCTTAGADAVKSIWNLIF